MNKRILSCLIASILLLLNLTVCAEEVEVLEAQLTTKNAEIISISNEIKDKESQKKELEKSILATNEDLSKLQTQLDELQVKIDTVISELDEAQKKEDAKKEVFFKRLIVMYEKGNVAYIEAFLASNDIMEMTKRTEYIRQISENDRRIFNEFAEAKAEVEGRKKELDDVSAEYNAQKEEYDLQINEASEEIETIDREIKQKKDALKNLKSEKNEIEKKLYKKTFAGRVFAEGEKYLGFPYVWGGSTPETSFDCSGFVCWTYTHSGVYNLPRTTAQGIYDQCKKISESEARPGDLIFFKGTYYAPNEPVTHIGIYAGDGKMLHCGNPIQYTSTQTAYWKSHFYAYGRLEK